MHCKDIVFTITILKVQGNSLIGNLLGTQESCELGFNTVAKQNI